MNDNKSIIPSWKRLRRIGRIAGRELGSIKSEKTIVLAILVQLALAGFSSYLIVGLVPLYSPQSTAQNSAVTFGVTGEATEEVENAIEEVPGANSITYNSYENAYSAYHNGEVNVVFRATETDSGRIVISTIVPESGVESTVIVSKTKSVLETLERNQRQALSERLEVKPLERIDADAGGGNMYFNFIYTVLIPLLAFLPVFTSGSLAADSINEGIEERTIQLLRSAPVTDSDIIIGKLSAMSILAPLQVLIWAALLLLNGITVQNLIPLAALVLGFTMFVSAVGSYTAMYYRERRATQFAYSAAIVLIFSLMVLLPEHPANSVAKLAIGNPTPTTWGMAVGALAVGVVSTLIAVYLADVKGMISPDYEAA